MKRVSWAAAAIDDLLGIRDHHADAGQELATDWLLDWPYAGRELGTSGWRKRKARRTPYLLIYRPVADGIDVSRVRHERENWLDDL